MFFQLGFAFLIPELLARLSMPYDDLKNMWPLNYYFFNEWNVKGMLDAGGFGLFMLLFGVAMIFLISPILTYFYGKRWYCSWVCGCGGLAETAGDPFRQLQQQVRKELAGRDVAVDEHDGLATAAAVQKFDVETRGHKVSGYDAHDRRSYAAAWAIF